MGRQVKGWIAEKVEDTPVAPHRYLWDRETGPDPDPSAMRVSEFCKQAPYQPGDVVYVDRGDAVKKARIIRVGLGHDRYGDRREEYTVQLETKKGLWAKNWVIAYPGPIQRGYQKMGLAPEMPEDA